VSASVALQGVPSLFGNTIRRSFVLGRIYLVFGIGYALLVAILTSFDSPTAFVSALSLFLPVFAVIGSMGGLAVFTGDRLRGVFEYLIAYGVSPRRLFVNVLAAGLVLVTLVLGSSLAFGLGLYLARGHTISFDLAAFLGLYAIPMSYASAAFAGTVGMFWTTLSSPRQGLNGPLGLMPIVGIAPAFLTLIGAAVVAAEYGASYLLVVTSLAVVILTAVVLLLLSQISRLLPLERLLSPA